MAKKNEVRELEVKELNAKDKTFKDRVFNYKWFYEEAEKIIKIAPTFKDFLKGTNTEEFLVRDFYTDFERPTFKIIETDRNELIIVKNSNELK
jgi:hypothetical protein